MHTYILHYCTYLYLYLHIHALPVPHLTHAAAFSDEVVHMEVGAKAAFWLADKFYGVDLTSLYKPAVDSYYAQVVVDAFDPSLLVSNYATRMLDLLSVKEEDLLDITIPLSLTVRVCADTKPGTVSLHYLNIRGCH